ncbi:hypothetical protein TOK_3733 [Pseudonocardia sp. N23]|nr:hypothetical protein TOK_3733 [Pseudonocardia sp. N23]
MRPPPGAPSSMPFVGAVPVLVPVSLPVPAPLLQAAGALSPALTSAS